MIGRTNRFHGRASIQRLYKSGKMVRSSRLSLRVAQHPHRDSYRLAVVVSKKIAKSAVTRNRIRRRIYEDVRNLSGSFTAPHDLLIGVYDADIAEIPAEELATELAKLFKKANLL